MGISRGGWMRNGILGCRDIILVGIGGRRRLVRHRMAMMESLGTTTTRMIAGMRLV